MAHFIIVNKETGERRMAPGSEIGGAAVTDRIGIQIVDRPDRWPNVDLAEDEILINGDESIWDSEAGAVRPLFTPLDQQVRELTEVLAKLAERVAALEEQITPRNTELT